MNTVSKQKLCLFLTLKPTIMKNLNVKFVYFLFAVMGFVSCQESEITTQEDASLIVSNTNNTSVELNDDTTTLITNWLALLLELDQNAYGMRPNATARALAYINLAAYETAVIQMDGFSSNEKQLRGLEINQKNVSDINVNIALNATYAAVLDHFIYNVANGVELKIAQLHQANYANLTVDVSNDVIEASEEWGNYVANQIIKYSQTDKDAEKQILEPQPLSYEPEVNDGYWTYSAEEERALFPYWSSVRTFVISSKETSSIPPVEYSEDTNSEYYAQMLEVYEVNNTAKAEDNDELWIAEFWSDDVEGLMISPPGRQISIAKQLIENNDMSYDASLAFLLKVGFALNDAAVSTWADKYKYMVMRPNVYIHEFIDTDFQTNLYRLVYWPNPSFPGYPSGHSAFASAAGGVFINEFGDATDFTDYTHEGRTEFRGTPRNFSTFSEMAEENAFSRIPLGVHIRMDCAEGLRLGYEIADAVNNYKLRGDNVN